ncbi:MAG: VCBS repeat-containing protein, partial [Candidatus Thermoplasmatota archaeon]|nr:VCBS repeat-containing protein [Candidatus Thermoplasmatota archaeon]
GLLNKGVFGGDSPQLIFTAIRGNDYYTTVPRVYSDAGGLDYISKAPYEFITRGTSAADTADMNGDGFMDVVFAVKQTGVDTYSTTSPLFLGGPLGMGLQPEHSFPTTGASDVLVEDLDGDGYHDVLFAQERRSAGDFQVNSTLYMGSADGWSDEPDLEFSTKGASGVIAVDLNGDDLADLVFSCYQDVGTSTDSMVFLQEATGFNGSSPDHTLPTKGARAVAAGDLDGDDLVDLVFANSLSGGFAEVDSYVYWGKTGGGFDATPLGLPTSGVEDVKVADLDGDDELDIVFANFLDNTPRYEVDSFVYLNGGGGTFSNTPDVQLPTEGATGVAVADLDGSGWLDLIFACQQNDTSYKASSRIYLGGVSGWSTTPDIEIPTEGASDVLVSDLFKHGTGGYLSRPIYIDFPARETGTVHTFRYTATLGASQEAELMLVDADSWEVLGSTSMATGSHEWDLTGLFRVKEHQAVRVMLVASGLEAAGQFTVDQLWFNWTKRVWQPPQILDLGLSEPSIYRTLSVDMWLEVTDDYDLPEELVLQLEHRVNGSDTWDDYLMGTFTYDAASGLWRTTITPKVNADLGSYDFRASASDLDSQYADWLEFPNMLEVMNNVPTTPEVHIAPDKAVTTSTLNIEFDVRATDVET